MVKVTFNSSFGQRDLKKACNAEALIPEERDLEDGMRVRRQSKVWCWCMCLGLALMLSGVVVGGAYLYKSYILQEDPVYFCGVDYRERDYMVPDEDEAALPSALRHIQESIRVLEEVELINVPVPEFSDSDPADIVHDFKSRLTAYLDLSLNKCYVIPLNTSIVMPPKDLLELLINIKAGTYLPQSYLVHEQMMVTERLENVDQLGYFIYSLCKGRDTYKLERRETILGREKREALNCRTIRHFENKFVVETVICEP
ncbi:integral membrane protein 2B-like [Salvelinus fontinalis]|uniref:Integral membrane protein 2 n=1 Tax=Salvelinus namaycush TaxID=8040 RepID=A0A8U0U1U9_SALNM|nr:integral membrane protein 2B-like [Salvelinus namaycush]XP_055764270.1 integral membrane protein 2B-like [Salvelinus fontinalis]